jgi:hypothetical protein
MRSSRPGPALPERVARGGARVAVTVTHGTVARLQPSGGTRLQRVGAVLLLAPALALMLVLAAILLAALIVAAALLAVALAVSAFVLRRS